MKRQSFKIVLTSVLVFLLLGVTAPLIFAETAGVISGIYLPFSGTVFNRQTGESVAISGDLHVIARYTLNSIITRVFLHRYDAMGVSTSKIYDVVSHSYPPDPIIYTRPDPSFGIFLVLSPGDPIIPPNPILPSSAMRVNLTFNGAGVLSGGMTTLNGSSVCVPDVCSNP